MMQQNLKKILWHTTKTWLALSLEILITATSFILFNSIGLSEGIGILLTFVISAISVAIGITMTYKNRSNIALLKIRLSSGTQVALGDTKPLKNSIKTKGIIEFASNIPQQVKELAFQKKAESFQWSRRKSFVGLATILLLLILVMFFYVIHSLNIGQTVNIIISYVPLSFILVGVFLLFLGSFNILSKPGAIHMASNLVPIRKSIIMVAFVFLLSGMGFQFLSFSLSAPYPAVVTATVSPNSTSVISSPSSVASSLIPAGQQPVIDDPLADNSKGYQWDTGNFAIGGCNFVAGHYLLTAFAGSDGEECNMEAPNTIFHNFVYQIQMTILSGLGNNESGAGPTFRVNTLGSGQQYQVTFDEKGEWAVATDVQDLSGGICANPCPYFHQGFGQPNTITIRAYGGSIQIQINGHPLGSYIDSMYAAGYIGVQMDPGTDNSSVAFSNVRVWIL